MARVNLSGQFNPPNYVDSRIDVYAYLVTCESDVLLIDTGVGEGSSYVERVFQPERTPMAEALARFGLKPADVTLLVNSHLHFDHCGNNRLFPGAEIFIQSEELAAARAARYTVREWFDYEGVRLSSVSGDREIRPEITLISTPGHTPGHQSVLVDAIGGNVLVAAQAAFTLDEYQRGGDPAVQAHDGLEREYLESIARLKSLDAQDVYFSHDAHALGGSARL